MSWSSDMENMESVMAVFDVLNGNSEPKLSDLVTPYRKFVRYEDMFVKEAPLSVSKKLYHRLFIFKDVIIIARHTGSKPPASSSSGSSASSSSTSTQSSTPSNEGGSSFWRRLSFRRNSKSSKDNIAARVEAAQKSKAEGTTSGNKPVQDNPSLSSSSSAAVAKDEPVINMASAISSIGKGKLIFAHYLPIEKCTFRSIGAGDDDGMHGIQVTFVQRISTPSPNGVGEQINTKVEKFEFWFERAPIRDMVLNMFDEFTAALRDEKKKDEGSNDGGSPGAATAKGRKWTLNKGRKSFEASLAAAAAGISLTDDASPADIASSTDSAEPDIKVPPPSSATPSTSTSPTTKSTPPSKTVQFEVQQTLDDLEKKYGIAFSTPLSLEEGRTTFDVEFPEGSMGLSLSSRDGIGVIVTKLVPDSIAEVGGVSIGDRISHIGGIELQLSQSWQNALDIIKAQTRPLDIKFERNPQIYDKIEEASKKTETEEGSSGQRKWNAKRATKVKSLATLHDLQKMYDEDAAKEDGIEFMDKKVTDLLAKMGDKVNTSEEKQCINIVKEILSTEKDYVSALRVTVGEFIIPLRRTTTKLTCKEDAEGSRLCEHGLIRSSCNRESKATKPLCKSDEVREIFMNTETLMKINSELFAALNKSIIDISEKKSDAKITDIVEAVASTFTKVLPFFNMYAIYCHQYPSAINKIKDLRQEKEFEEFFQKREASAAISHSNDSTKKILPITSLLIRPVQRICKYPLLFTELLKSVGSVMTKWKESGNESQNVPDNLQQVLENLRDANSQIQKIADDVNQKVHVQDAINSVVDIYEELGGGKDGNLDDLFVPSRRYLGSYEVFVRLSHETGSDPVLHKLFLFNDWIILSLPKVKSSTKYVTTRKKSVSADRASSVNLGKDGLKWSKIYGIDLRQTEIKLIIEKYEQDYSGFLLKFVDRKPFEEKGITRIDTQIHKFDIFLPSNEERSELFQKIQDNIDVLAQQKEDEEKGKEKFGGAEINKKRSWKKKSNQSARHINSFASATDDESSNASDMHQSALSDIARRYTKDGQE